MELNVNAIFSKIPVVAMLTDEQKTEVKEVLTNLGGMESFSTSTLIFKKATIDEVETTIYEYKIDSINRHLIKMVKQNTTIVDGSVIEIGIASYGVVNIIISEGEEKVAYCVAIESL